DCAAWPRRDCERTRLRPSGSGRDLRDDELDAANYCRRAHDPRRPGNSAGGGSSMKSHSVLYGVMAGGYSAGFDSMKSAMARAMAGPWSSCMKWLQFSRIWCGCPFAPGTLSWKTWCQPSVATSPAPQTVRKGRCQRYSVGQNCLQVTVVGSSGVN